MNMTLDEIISRIRPLVYDTAVPYRLTDTVIVSWLNLGLNDLRTKRPDSSFDANNNKITAYVAIDDVYDYYTYTDSSGYAYLSNLQNITGWVKATYPVLYMKASSTTNINIYPTDADRTAGTNLMGHIGSCGTAGTKTVTADAVALGGTVTLAKAVTSTNVWNITATEASIPCDDTFQEPLMYYIASKWYESDSDDTQDAGLSQKYYQKYLQGIKT
jgi:hypothetical protein